MQLDQYQQAVIDTDPKANIKVVGAPGSGKTMTLVTRYAHLYINHGFDPKRMLVLTFSKKAADEMGKRINGLVDISRQAKSQISTINAFCYRLYNDWRVGANMKPLRVWQYGDKVKNPNFVAADLMLEYLKTTDLSIFDYINKTLKSSVNPSPDDLKEAGIGNHDAHNGFKAWREYEIWMKENNLVDFYGQVWNVDRLLEERPIFSMMIGQRFDKIICDEVQDMFPQTYRILLKLAKHSSIEMFGDPSQSIYGFLDAAPHLFYGVEAKVPNMQIYHLANNYRSTSNIVDVVNDFGPQTTEKFEPMNCVKNEEPGNVTIHGVEKISHQSDYIAEQIEENGYKYGDIYVLARTNSQCSSIHQRLIELGIPSYYAGNFSIWDKTHMKAAIGYTAIAKGQDSPDDLLSVLNVPSENYTNAFGANKGRYSPTRFLPKDAFQGKSFSDIVNGLFAPSRAQRPGVGNIKKFIDHLRGIDNRGMVADIQGAISKWSQWTGGDYMAVEDDLSMLWDKLENLDYNVDHLRIYIQKMNEAKRKIKTGMNKVQVMTIHQAKGLESLIVFLTGLSEPISRGYSGQVSIKAQNRGSGFHPGRNTNPNINEECCLYYVGISRAIRHLYLTFYETSGEVSYELSSFVNRLAIERGLSNGPVQ